MKLLLTLTLFISVLSIFSAFYLKKEMLLPTHSANIPVDPPVNIHPRICTGYYDCGGPMITA